LIELAGVELNACLMDCSGRGDCLKDYHCKCDSDWYLADCSGGLGDNQIALQLENKLA